MPLIAPDYDDFERVYRDGTAQVVWTSLVGDLETPVSGYLKLAVGRTNTFLLESVEGGSIRGRYSFIGLNPDLIWRCNGNQAEVNYQALHDAESFVPCPGDALTSLRATLDDSLIDLPEDLPPMAAGMVGYMGYDTVRLSEDLPNIPPDSIGLPDGLFVRPTVMGIFDSVKDLITIVTPVRPVDGVSAKAAFVGAEKRLGNIVNLLEGPTPESLPPEGEMTPRPPPISNTKTAEYIDMVTKAKDYIAAGDIFQVVLSQRYSVPFDLPAITLYRALRRTNPSPFLFLLNFEGFGVVGSSPEILVRLRDGQVTIRPIAGTRPRGASRKEDDALAEELLADPKELAEHLMLLDLGRNDVGRVAKVDTVKVTEQNNIELYSHVMHIVSNVVGDIDPKRDAIDALIAGFPAGTVSGAPKIRAMQIIDELEKEKRGIYAGGVGYFSANGSMDTCIVLRTAVVKDDVMHVQAGAGIVADSIPEKENAECQAKARALIQAADTAQGRP